MYGIVLDQVDTMARTLWGEARGEGLEGIIAVANVIMNRVKNPTWWGHDVISVCTKPWQFSCWNKNDPNRQKLINVTNDDPQFQACKKIAAVACDGNLDDITDGSTNYFDLRMPQPPAWAKEKAPTVIIGNHAFFNNV